MEEILSKETERVLKVTQKKLQRVIKQHGKLVDGFPIIGTGIYAMNNIIKTIASTNCKKAWEFLMGCYENDDYAIMNDVIGEVLSGSLSRYHRYEEIKEAAKQDNPTNPTP
jgi:hypothetical protein